jgi:hypothetical protein
MLLVRHPETESETDLYAYLQTHYDARLNDSNFGPLYQIGPAFMLRDLKFSQIQTLAGSLIMRIVFDAEKGKFDKPIIYRYDTEGPFRLLIPGSSESVLNDDELIKIKK